MSVIGMPLFVLSSFNIKERIVHPNAQKRAPGEPSTLSRIFKCKPLMLVVLSGSLSFEKVPADGARKMLLCQGDRIEIRSAP